MSLDNPLKPRIESLTIEHFRVFKSLKLEGLGMVTLITGQNNTGKSTILEALRIVASEASPTTLYSILYSREEDFEDDDDPSLQFENIKNHQLTNLFHGYPVFEEEMAPIIINSSGRKALHLKVTLGLFYEDKEENGRIQLLPKKHSFFDDSVYLPALGVYLDNIQKVYPISMLSRRHRRQRPDFREENRFPCLFVPPCGSERTWTLGYLWDRIVLEDDEKFVIEALRLIEPNITAITMIGGEGRLSRRVIIRSKNFGRAVPLRSFGDGLNRLFNIALALVNSKNGLLLIDEFENGIHHSIQVSVWKIIFKLAKELDIQVVATSHSEDAIEAFQKVANENQENGVLFRLTKKGENIIPTVFTKEELAVAAKEHIEVR